MTAFAKLDAEWLCLRQFTRSSLRHVRYFRVFLFLTIYRLISPSRALTLRYGFGALQWIDDLLDGDRKCVGEPWDVVNAIRKSIVSGQFTNRPEQRLMKALVNELQRLPSFTDSQRELLAVIDAMMVDRERVRDLKILTSAELREQHRKTFSHSINLTLIAMRSSLRAAEFPSALDLLGWCSTVRDFREDLRKGLNNVPQEILSLEELPPQPEWSTQIPKNRAVLAWLNDYTQEAVIWMKTSEEEIARHSGEPGVIAVKILIGSSRKHFPRGTIPVTVAARA